jgi:hypothetical protein
MEVEKKCKKDPTMDTPKKDVGEEETKVEVIYNEIFGTYQDIKKELDRLGQLIDELKEAR